MSVICPLLKANSDVWKWIPFLLPHTFAFLRHMHLLCPLQGTGLFQLLPSVLWHYSPSMFEALHSLAPYWAINLNRLHFEGTGVHACRHSVKGHVITFVIWLSGTSLIVCMTGTKRLKVKGEGGGLQSNPITDGGPKTQVTPGLAFQLQQSFIFICCDMISIFALIHTSMAASQWSVGEMRAPLAFGAVVINIKGDCN